MQTQRLGAVAIGSAEHVYYFTGFRAFWQHFAGFVLFSDGRSVLVSAGKPDASVAADQHIPYEAAWLSTNRQEQPSVVATNIATALKERKASRIAIDASAVGACVSGMLDRQLASIDADLWQLRRRKDPDELKIMKVAIDCTRAMYDRARQIIEPGVPELRVFDELHAAAVTTAGEPMSAYLGNDYACGERGGAPRNGRVAAAGELYILDLGPAVRGYFADNCRVFAVDRKLTDSQHKACEIVVGVFPIVENLTRPGVRCRDIFSAVDEYYQSKTGRPFPHHLGHGVGLQPHEFPHLNPKWDDTLMEGEIFTCEPGLYGGDLNAGIRIENQYRVTASGIENLTPFAMEMTM
jgi:Xaa-Pro dipeptidase